MAKEELRTRSEVVGVTAGLLIFFAGIGLLVFVFALAFRLFGDPGILTAFATSAPAAGAEAAGPPVSGIFATMGAKIAYLFIMLLAGSLVSSKGIHLYMASR